MRRRLPSPRLLGVLGFVILLGACAARPDPSDPEAVAEFRAVNDPVEPLNRGLYFVNDGIDTLVLRPAAEAYRIIIPPEFREAIRNVLGNLRTPIILVNDVLQGETQRAGVTLGRFVINTTIGVGGIWDRARDFGLLGHTEDFGQTLAVWGTPEGPYMFVPVLGPTNPRDLTGFGVDIATNPLTWIGGNDSWDAVVITRQVLISLDTREGLIEPLDALREGSLDPYAALRSAYRQRRNREISNVPTTASPAARGTGYGIGPEGFR
jgi:phospholipid-binding lipoprotein MlaA